MVVAGSLASGDVGLRSAGARRRDSPDRSRPRRAGVRLSRPAAVDQPASDPGGALRDAAEAADRDCGPRGTVSDCRGDLGPAGHT